MRWLLLQESISLDGSLYRKLIALMYNCLARFSFLYILYLQVLWEVSHSSQTAINLALKHQKWMLWPTETAISTKKKTQLFEVNVHLLTTVVSSCRRVSRETVGKYLCSNNSPCLVPCFLPVVYLLFVFTNLCLLTWGFAFLSPQQTFMRHHWVHRRRQEGKCKQCGKVSRRERKKFSLPLERRL